MNYQELTELFAPPGAEHESGGHCFIAGPITRRPCFGPGHTAAQWWKAATCSRSFYCEAHSAAAKPGLIWHAGAGTCRDIHRAGELAALGHDRDMKKARELLAKFGVPGEVVAIGRAAS